MPPENPQLASIAVMIREDGKALFVRHAAGPFGGRWSLPFVGVGQFETAEDAIERLMREVLHVQPGPYEFLDTVYLNGAGGERFIANGFTCVDWEGTPRFPPAIFDDALWAPVTEGASLDLLPEMREWLTDLFGAETDASEAASYDPQALIEQLADARGDLLVAFDAIPAGLRANALDEAGWSALDVLAHAVDVEAYYRSELVRCLEERGRAWRLFNDDEWYDVHRLRPRDDEQALRERAEAVRTDTRRWLTYQSPDALAEYVNHPERGVVQAGNRIAKIADHDRQHAAQLREMARAAVLRTAADDLIDEDGSETEGRP